MAEVPPTRGTVCFMTLRADARVRSPDNNELIKALPAQYPNVQVIDWDDAVQQRASCAPTASTSRATAATAGEVLHAT